MTYDADDSDPEPHETADETAVPATGVRGYSRRNRVMQIRRITKSEAAIGALLWPERNFWRPRARADCANVARPCPHVSCRYHLYLDIQPTGGIKLNFPGLEPWELATSCALDVAELGEHTLEEVGSYINVTRERLRQIEDAAFGKLCDGAHGLTTLLHAFVPPPTPAIYQTDPEAEIDG